jgi:hypothetical protein
MLLMSNLMGGQIGRNCLTVEEMFINGQIIRECLGAESGALPFTLHNVRQRGLTSYQGGQGLTSLVINGHPRVLSLTAG